MTSSLALVLLALAAGPSVQEEPAPAPAPSPAVSLRPRVVLDADGRLLQAGRVLTRPEFFLLADRGDLVARSEHNVAVRRWLWISAGAALVAGLVVGAIMFALVPNPDHPYCRSSFEGYDQCTHYINLYGRAGAGTMASGAVLAGLLAAIGLWHRPDVLSNRDLKDVVSLYNRGP